jgi:hypothetical protein
MHESLAADSHRLVAKSHEPSVSCVSRAALSPASTIS